LGAVSTLLMRSQGRLSQRSSIILNRREKRDLSTSSRQVLCMMESGREVSEMVMVNRFGQMVLNILESGERTEHMAKELLYMWMEMFMRGIGQTIRPMELVFIDM
jgi:hypothetical protein